jgi:hypothetical protein
MSSMVANEFDGGFGESYFLDMEIDLLKKPNKRKELCESLLNPEIHKELIKQDGAKEFADFFTYKVKDLRESIDQISKEISIRFEMKKEFDKELDYQLSRAALSLSEFRHWGLGYNTGVDVKRNMLEKQLTDFRREKRKTELQCWEDIISLKKDLRKVLEEYKALLNRKEVLK